LNRSKPDGWDERCAQIDAWADTDEEDEQSEESASEDGVAEENPQQPKV
jgi:hypothetical protein